MNKKEILHQLKEGLIFALVFYGLIYLLMLL